MLRSKEPSIVTFLEKGRSPRNKLFEDRMEKESKSKSEMQRYKKRLQKLEKVRESEIVPPNRD